MCRNTSINISRAMKYAELHRNMQKPGIKSPGGNKLSIETIGQLAESTRPMLKLADQLKPATGLAGHLSESFKGVDAIFKDKAMLGRFACPTTE